MAHSGHFHTDAGSSFAFLFKVGPRSLHQRHSDHVHPHGSLWLLGKIAIQGGFQIPTQHCSKLGSDTHVLHEMFFVCTNLFLGSKGNKGGVSIRLSFYGHMLCFLNCHLTAHMNNASHRVYECEHILDAQTFDAKNTPHILDHKSVHDNRIHCYVASHSFYLQFVLFVYYFNHYSLWFLYLSFWWSRAVFWFGDLNFRIEDHGMNFIRNCLTSQRFDLLWPKDQVLTWSLTIRDIVKNRYFNLY